MTLSESARRRAPVRIATSAVGLALLQVLGCGQLLGFPPEPTAEQDPPTKDASTDAPADTAAEDCDQEVLADWKAHPPAVGLASTSFVAAYDAIIQKVMHDYGVDGGAVALTNRGRLVLARGYGFADRDTYQPAHPDSLFRVADLSMQITSTAIMMLVQQGKVALDDKAFAILDDLQPLPGQTRDPATASITVKNLLQDTAGWDPAIENDPVFQSATIRAAAGGSGPPDCDTTIRYMLGRAPSYTPGTVLAFSNFEYCVLGAVIEKVTGTKYASWVSQNILTPVGAREVQQGRSLFADRADGEVTYYDGPGAPLVPSVFGAGADLVPAPYGSFYLEGMPANLGWVSSPIDILRIQAALDGRQAGVPALLTTESLLAMEQNPNVKHAAPGGPVVFDSDWFGFGWQMKLPGNWWHRGDLPGAWSIQLRVGTEQDKYGWAASFNGVGNDRNGFASAVDNALWEALPNLVKTAAWSADDWFDQYASPFTSWMSASDYGAMAQQNKLDGKYPTHTEGQLRDGVPMFRSRFARFRGAAFHANYAASCADYKQTTAQARGEGMSLVSVQSFVDATGHREYQSVWAR